MIFLYLVNLFRHSNCLLRDEVLGTSHPFNAMPDKPVWSIVQIFGYRFAECVDNAGRKFSICCNVPKMKCLIMRIISTKCLFVSLDRCILFLLRVLSRNEHINENIQ